MSPEQQVQRALTALAEHDRQLGSQTPAHAIFARRRPAILWRPWAALAAAAVLALFLWPRPKAEAPQPVAAVQETRPVVVAAPIPAPPKPVPVRRVRPPQPAPREIVTDFYPLMDAPPPFERGHLLRVMVPASTMRSVGLSINPDRWAERVQADVLVGEEGMARAIRFVSYEQ